jgi:YD repeat-containing protein
MLRPVGAMQRADLWRTGRAASPIWRSVRVLALFVCCVTALFIFGVAPAIAEEHIVSRPNGIKEHELIADNYSGTIESEPEYMEPAGYYMSGGEGLGEGGDGTYEYTEECAEGYIGHECKGLHTVIGQNSEGTLPSGFAKLEHLEIESLYMGRRTVVYYRYGWSPASEFLGEENKSEPKRKQCNLGGPVNCATGNQIVTQTDLSVGGRGPGLTLTRTYNSMLASTQSTAGPLGFGWTGPYSAHLELNGEEAIVHENNGSTTRFRRSEGAWTAPSSLVEAALVDEGSGYAYTLSDQTKLHFNSSGELTSEEDRNGNAITLAYNAEKQLESATDGAGRKLTFKYNGSGEVESAKDPMGHTVKYTYESGNLASVTQPGEEKTRWKFKYNSIHELTSETDGREHTLTTEYNEADQVASQTDAMSRKRTWKYAEEVSGTETRITELNGTTTVEKFNEYGSPTSITHASGTSNAATTTYEYNGSDELMALTDPNKHTTEYGYDSEGNRTSEKNADGDETNGNTTARMTSKRKRLPVGRPRRSNATARATLK